MTLLATFTFNDCFFTISAKLGANAILGVSLAVCKAGAAAKVCKQKKKKNKRKRKYDEVTTISTKILERKKQTTKIQKTFYPFIIAQLIL